MRSLDVDREEAESIYKSDRDIDHDMKQDFDLSLDKLKVAKSYTRTGTRETTKSEAKTQPAYKFTKRERKPNATKGGIINELAEFLAHGSQFETDDVQIINKEREILLRICSEWYKVTLSYCRNMNKQEKK